MKRILALALSAMMVLSLAACASAKAAGDGNGTTGEPTAIEETGGVTVGGCSYAVTSDGPLSAGAMAALIAQIR